MIASSQIKQKQQTIDNIFLFNGIGLHSGKNAKVTVFPSDKDTGINFVRTDVKNTENNIEAIWYNVVSSQLSTTISNNDGVSVGTIEHLMSALSGMHIDNAIIHVEGPEIPIMDGRSMPFVKLIEKAGIRTLDTSRKIIKVKKDIEVSKGDSYVKISPYEQFSIDFEIFFDSDLINRQSCHLQLINGNYKSDISSARTFGFEKDVEDLRSNGFALGGSLENAVVVGEDKILNSEGLRFEDEFVRHKILDSIGDLYLAGLPIEGYLSAKKSGHYLNNQLLRKLLSDKSNFEII